MNYLPGLRLTDIPGSPEWIKSVGRGSQVGPFKSWVPLSFLPRGGRVMHWLQRKAGRALQVLWGELLPQSLFPKVGSRHSKGCALPAILKTLVKWRPSVRDRCSGEERNVEEQEGGKARLRKYGYTSFMLKYRFLFYFLFYSFLFYFINVNHRSWHHEQLGRRSYLEELHLGLPHAFNNSESRFKERGGALEESGRKEQGRGRKMEEKRRSFTGSKTFLPSASPIRTALGWIRGFFTLKLKLFPSAKVWHLSLAFIPFHISHFHFTDASQQLDLVSHERPCSGQRNSFPLSLWSLSLFSFPSFFPLCPLFMDLD